MFLALLLLVPVAVDLVRRPTFRRFALRNISRRRGEAALVVVGSLLGTAIITASFIVGVSIDAAIRDTARTELGPIDEAVRADDASTAAAIEGELGRDPLPGSDGILRIVSTPAVSASVGDARRGDPNAGIVEVDFDRARGFGGDASATGLEHAGSTPRGDEAVIGERVASRLGVAAGSPIEVFAYGTSRRLTVRNVVADVGIVGYLPVQQAGFDRVKPAPVLVAPGTIEAMARAGATPAPGSPGAGSGSAAGTGAGSGGSAAGTGAGSGGSAAGTGAAPPSHDVVVSNAGGVFDSAGGTDGVVAEIERRLAAAGITGVEVQELKRDLLDAAKEAGDGIGQLYTSIGGFSVVAGVLLLVNLFVMLAEERKVELGMLRAAGFKRNHLVRTFAIEGALYSVAASFLGGIVGIGVGWGITQLASRIFSQTDDGLVYGLHAPPATVLTGMAVGLTISMLTVWGTSLRISRLNVIRAIRDLPEPPRKPGPVGLIVGGLGVAVGGLIFAAGVSGASPIPTLIGVPIALFSAIPLLSRILPRKPVVFVTSAGALVWGIGVFSFFEDAMARSGAEVFLFQGITLVSAAVALLSSIDAIWTRTTTALSGIGIGLAARLGLAYPLARQFRTSMLLGMYAIVIFTMTFISVFGGIFEKQAPAITAAMSSGYDVFLDSSPTNPVPVDVLEDHPAVAAVAPIEGSFATFTTATRTEPEPWKISGYDPTLLRFDVPKLESRMPEFSDDRAVWEAVLADPTKAVVPSFFLQRGGGPPESRLKPGDMITIHHPATRETRDVVIAGINDNDFVFNGVMVAAPTLRELMGPLATSSRRYLKLEVGTDPSAVAAQLNGSFIENGVDAQSFASRVQNFLAINTSFFGLMRGYLGLGLLIGIAGLGVVMVRAVRERRRQIGMLRAMGFSSRVVRRAFVLESAFIALQGILLGTVLGLVTSYQLVVNSSTFGDQALDFVWPWAALALTVVVPLLASLVATAAPAAQASRIRPAVALRIAD